MKNARISFRDGDSYLTQIDENQAPETLAQRMCSGGFLICADNRWGRDRVLVINLGDVKCIELVPVTIDASSELA